MNFKEYQWFKNPRGLRNNGPYLPVDPDRYSSPKMGWARLVAGGSEHIDTVKTLASRGVMPIVSFHRERMGAAAAPNAWYDLYLQYIDAGALWFELYEEPNSDSFWPLAADGGKADPPNWNRQDNIKPLMDNWLTWAEQLIKLGGYPAFPAMAETTLPNLSTIKWIDICLTYLKEAAHDRFMAVLAKGLWVATHPFIMNHFYQEPPGGPSNAQRPYYQQSAADDGWHFEYPYDPIQQHDDPGRTVFGGTDKSPEGDPNGLVATGEAFQELLRNAFGAGPVPVIGTAGGIYPVPAHSGEETQPDMRYLPYSRESHGEATAAMFDWIARHGPPWFFGLTLTSDAEYYPTAGAVPAIAVLAGRPPAMKDVPDLDVTQGIAISAKPAPPPPPTPPAEYEPETLETAGQPVVTPMPEPDLSTLKPTEPDIEPEPLPVVTPASPPEPVVTPMPEPDLSTLKPTEPDIEPEPLPVVTPASPLPQDLQEPVMPEAIEPTEMPPAAGGEQSEMPVPADPARGQGGGPEFHWLMAAPNLPEGWLWDCLLEYWSAFHPTIIPSVDYLGLIPGDRTVALTVIAPAGGAEAARQSVLTQYPHVKVDVIAGANVEMIQNALELRAEQQREYG